jgi:signal recognition particle subunit SRP72
VLAAYVAAGLAKEVVKLMSSMKITSKQSFEIGYNKACGLLELGQYAAAESELKQAFRLGEAALRPCCTCALPAFNMLRSALLTIG